MTVVNWGTFKNLMELQEQLTSRSQESSRSWTPAVDIFEKGDVLVIRAELPGVDRDDVDISIENNTLLLRGERKRETEFVAGEAHCLERAFGAFTRSFTLPKTVDTARISASYDRGVLELTLPKVEQAKPRKIEIKAA